MCGHALQMPSLSRIIEIRQNIDHFAEFFYSLDYRYPVAVKACSNSVSEFSLFEFKTVIS